MTRLSPALSATDRRCLARLDRQARWARAEQRGYVVLTREALLVLLKAGQSVQKEKVA